MTGKKNILLLNRRIAELVAQRRQAIASMQAECRHDGEILEYGGACFHLGTEIEIEPAERRCTLCGLREEESQPAFTVLIGGRVTALKLQEYGARCKQISESLGL